MSFKKKPTQERLQELYVTQGLTAKEIGALLDAAPETVRKWLHHYKIPLRPLTHPIPEHAPSRADLQRMIHTDLRTYQSIGKQYGAGPTTVQLWIDKYQIPRPIRGAAIITKGKPTADELRALYLDQRMTTRQIGAQFGVRHITIRRWLNDYGIEARAATRGLENRGIEPPTRDELHRMVHVEHLGYRRIADRYGVDPTAVPYWLTAHGIAKPTVWQTRRRGQAVVPPTVAELRAAYEAGDSIISIANAHGVGPGLIRQMCEEHDITVRDGGWQGGRRWACADGHEVRSGYEQRVDDWLTQHGLAHELEPKLPFDRRLRGDFLVGDVYIEVWGVTNSPTYTARRKRKTALYHAHGLPLIGLREWTFARATWKNRLAALLPEQPVTR